MVKKFPVFLEYDIEYEGFVADCPTLPGCMSQGKTKEEALKNIKEAIRGYLTVLKKHAKTTIPTSSLRISSGSATSSDKESRFNCRGILET